MREIIVDNFAGGGGASTGIEMATGRSVDIAINHDPNAIAMHTINHPDTLHYCESVFDINPAAATAGAPVGLAWFSPDCRHFSKAKGSTPVKKEIRGLAWIVIRWALAVRPRVMMLENVEEFKTWGPLLVEESRPDLQRAGETFAAFVGMLTTGIAADHPALDEVCESLQIDRHGTAAAKLVKGLGYDVEHRELRACDFGAPTIRKRFFMVMRCDGTEINWPEATHGDPKSLSVQAGQVEPWRTAAECIDWSLDCPSIFDRKKPLAENTMRRIARGIKRFVLENPAPFIVKCNHTSTKTAYDCFRGQALTEPLQTITKTHGYAVVEPKIAPFITGNGGSEYQAKPRALDKPAHTIMKESRACLVSPTLIEIGYGERPGQAPRAPGLDRPIGTIVAGGGKHALVSAFLAKHFGGNYTGPGAAMDAPVHTITTTDHHALVTSNLIKLRGTCKDGQRTDAPMPTITAGGLHVGEVRALLEAFEGKGESNSLGIVNIDGVDFQIVDIGMRMLQPHELYAAQGFPSWYVIDRDSQGNKFAKDKQVARCGNAVPPPFAEALVRANLPELCEEKKGAVA
jgi:DNA (cytosine-5)-methyltransferase 1